MHSNALVLLCLFLTTSQKHTDFDKLVENHNAAFKSVSNIICLITVDNIDEKIENKDIGKYYRLGNNFYATSKTNKFTFYNSSISGIKKGYQVFTNEKEGGKLEGSILTKDYPFPCDAFRYGLLTFFGNKQFSIPFSDFYSDGAQVQFLGKSSFEGIETTLVEVNHRRSSLKIHFDPKVNYLARAVIMREPKVPLTDIAKVVEFAEIEPGIFFPKRSEGWRANDQDGKWKQLWRSEISEVQLNPNLTNADLDITFPQGCVVKDHIKGKVYIADGLSGIEDAYRRPDGTEIRLVENPPGQIFPEKNQEVGQSSTPAWSIWDYFFPMSIVLTLGLILAWLIWKWRS